MKMINFETFLILLYRAYQVLYESPKDIKTQEAKRVVSKYMEEYIDWIEKRNQSTEMYLEYYKQSMKTYFSRHYMTAIKKNDLQDAWFHIPIAIESITQKVKDEFDSERGDVAVSDYS